MRQANVLFKSQEAGILTQHDDGSFTFCYNNAWMADNNKPAISLTLPKSEQPFHAVSKWCNDTCQPDFASIIKIAEILNVDLNKLVNFNHKS